MSYDYAEDYDCYYDEEESYGLCDGCRSEDRDLGKCMHYDMPLKMVKRKKKCKHYIPWDKCKCGYWMENYCDSWICYSCGMGIKGEKDSLDHKKFLLSQINWRLENPNHSWQYSTKHPSYRRGLRELQHFYLRNLSNLFQQVN